MPSESRSGWSPPASNSERRLSNSSDGSACSGYSKATSDSADFLATRPHTAAVIPGKPAANPLQFIKVGPADLGSRAREQLRRAELAKKTDTAKIERQEDWQSNLDNWKSSRRKRVEHIIERCVEVRRMETEPTQPRAKSKTFNEMLEERAGRRKKNHLAVYLDDDSHDLSDLGIGTSSTKSSLSEDCDTQSLASDGMDLDKNHSDVDNMSNCDLNRKLGSSANEYDTCTTTTISSPEPEEYTYEGAIEGYKSRIISQTNSSMVKTLVNNNQKEKSPDKLNGDLNRIRTSVSHKIEQKVSSFQQERNNDIKNNNMKKDLPKVDIHKRREQFERENSQESQTNKPKQTDISSKTSIKDRLYSFQKISEENQVQRSTSDLTKLPTDVMPLKERLTSLEKIKSGVSDNDKVKRPISGDLSNSKSLKERLSSLKSQTSEEEVKISKVEVSKTIKERLSDLDAEKRAEIPRISIEEQMLRNDKTDILNDEKDEFCELSMKSSLAGIESQMQSFCRSLDSLDINGQSSPSSFDRVQSLEDFECAEIQNNTVPSDIETEDSGIHTARDSCAPADDIADLTQVASPIGEPMVEVSEYESPNEDCLITLDQPAKIEEPVEKPTEPICAIPEDIIIEEVEETDPKSEDSESNYVEAVSQPEEFSVTDEVTEIQMDKEDEDTLKSLENQDTSVSQHEPVSNSSDGNTVVFEGKMTIHVNLNEICNNMGVGSGNKTNSTDSSTSNSTNSKSMPMVIDALELAFQELDSEDSINKSAMDDTDKAELIQAKTVEPKVNSEKKAETPLYENVDIFDHGLVDVGAFPLDLPTTAMQPPKEKPPPPPVEDNAEDELLGNGSTFKHTSSARRIKKEIRNKRTSFLGIEGQVDDSYLDADLTLAPRPDITSFLQEETKIERLLYKKTLSHDMDAKLRDSRDSGVDVDRGPSAEAWYRGQSSAENSNAHSRQNSEPYTHVTVTSDEEESSSNKTQQFTANLTNKLTDLSKLSTDDRKIDSLDKKLEQTQRTRSRDCVDGGGDDSHTKEVLRFERELLQLEQEELRRQRDNLIRDQTRIIQQSVHDVSTVPAPEKAIKKSPNPNYRHSMPNLLLNEGLTTPPQTVTDSENKRKPFVSEEHIQRHFGVEESRRVLYDDRARISEAVRKPVTMARYSQPILPPKPKTRESVEREITMRSSRVPSAVEYPHDAVEPPISVQLRPKPQINGNYAQMTRHTLQALSAAPTPKLISNSEWQRPRRPPTYNYNHWLIQEAEQRRIDEQRAKMRAQQRHSFHQDVTPNLHNMMSLSTSQQNLPHEYKRPLRTEVPLRNDVTRELPIRPDITPRPDLPMRPEVAKRSDNGQRTEILNLRPENHRLDNNHRTENHRPEINQRSDLILNSEVGNRPELRSDLSKRPEVPIRTDSRPQEKEEKVLSVSGKRKCSHCGEELGRGAAMIIESLGLCYHVWCFRCGVCGAALGDGRAGADVRVRSGRLHCGGCYSAEDGSKYSRV